jgi:hypothetical protein
LRALVFLLVLGNLLFLAFAGGYFGGPDNPDAGRIGQQLAAESVRIVGYGQTPPSSAEVEKQAAAAPPAEPEELCLLWENLPADAADRLASTLAEKLAGIRVERSAVPVEGAGWWVMVPPLANKAEADKKVGELKELGVSDLFVVHDAGPSHDLLMARNAGVDSLAVTYGAHPHDHLLDHRPLACLHSVAELGAWLKTNA